MSSNTATGRLLGLFPVEKRLELSLVREACLIPEVLHLKLGPDTRENLGTTRCSAELEPFHHLLQFARKGKEAPGHDSSVTASSSCMHRVDPYTAVCCMGYLKKLRKKGSTTAVVSMHPNLKV